MSGAGNASSTLQLAILDCLLLFTVCLYSFGNFEATSWHHGTSRWTSCASTTGIASHCLFVIWNFSTFIASFTFFLLYIVIYLFKKSLDTPYII